MRFNRRTATLALLVFALAVPAFAAAPTVTITPTPTTVTPGATVTLKATVNITDGSTLQTISWKQTGGPAATLTGTSTDTVTMVVPSRNAIKVNTIKALEEPPIPEDTYPKWVPKNEFFGGLQDRWGVVAMSNHGHDEGRAIAFEITVVTTSGTYKIAKEVLIDTPWEPNPGIRNVAIGTNVLLHGKKQATYDWKIASAPTGSTATLTDATTQDPDFTPDVRGEYKLTVTDTTAGKTIAMSIFAGTWKGIVTGQTAGGNPVPDLMCTRCHQGIIDKFTPWAKTGHAHIFSDQVTTEHNHYGPNCWTCHTVGYDKTVANNGMDDQSDFAALEADKILYTPGDAGNWTKILSKYPNAARFTNIQCENCHGPQNNDTHTTAIANPARMDASSNSCAVCHGEPARHGRYQQWQLSGHANYETAMGEGTNASCAKCHSAQGFLQWDANDFSSTPISVTWTVDEVHPITCPVCHDPHDVGTASTTASGTVITRTDTKMRMYDNTPMLDAGFKVTGAGNAAICMACHNGRRGLRDEAHFSTTPTDLARAPHVGPQTDVLYGNNMYFTTVGNKGNHAMITDSCVICHLRSTAQPTALANPGGGSNHTFYADNTICSKCHTSITTASVQDGVKAKVATLEAQIETALLNAMQSQIRAGNVMDLNGTKVKNAADIKSVQFIESHGAQGMTVTLADGTKVADFAMSNAKVVRPGSSTGIALYTLVDPSLPKAGWNYFMVESDKSWGVHNPAFINSALDSAIMAVKTMNAYTSKIVAGGGADASIGGGLGNGAGAVSCTTPYVYWTEIAAHAPGNVGTQWRSDLIARNLATGTANVKFVLHQSGTNLTGTGTVSASSQKAFEDIVATLGGSNNIGSLEICSDKPLLVQSRIFTASTAGTFGQNLEGKVADLGYGAGQTVNLIGMRQKSDAWRSNIVVTNAGKVDGSVSISLYDSTGALLKTYTLAVPAGMVVQDNEPFRVRAEKGDVDWGFATVTVVTGANIHASGSMVDMKTNDPTTITAQQ